MQHSYHGRILSLVVTILATLCAATAHGKPNIVFIFADDHSIQTIGDYGARLSEFCRQQDVTPNIDRLAAAGVVFPNSFLAATHFARRAGRRS